MIAPGHGLSFPLSLSICQHWENMSSIWHRENVSYCLVLHYLYKPSMLTPTFTFLTMSFTGEVSLLQDGAVGARVIQASAHVSLAGGGAVKLLPYVLPWSLAQVGGNLLPRGGAGLCTLPY